MRGPKRLRLLLPLLLLLSGCASVISEELRAKADPNLTIAEVRENPNGYKGKIVVWGGEIVQSTVRKDKTTLIEVLERPLGRMDEPQETGTSGGRFLVHSEKYLDPDVYREGRRITVAGRILGETGRTSLRKENPDPVLSGEQIYLWTDYVYQPTPAHDPRWPSYGRWW